MNNDVDQVKSRLDIVEFISKYLPLKKSGINYSSLCPFHQEKSPSFMVNPERQSFKCFGCDAGGDVIDFVMRIEGLEFLEALETLAEQTGVKLTPLGRDATSSVSTLGNIPKSRLYELNAYLADLWHQIFLKHPSAKSAREYLQTRQLKEATIKTWQIGFAPPARVTTDQLNKKGFSQSVQSLAGSPAKFEGRIIFPIFDLVGKVSGFTGRVLSKDAFGPKYLNTPETPVFYKSKMVYGLNHAKQFIKEKDLTLLVEGQMDVVTLHQAGYQYAVAASGTSLTEDHLKIIKRFSTNLAIAFDQDEAGQKAAERVIKIAFSQDVIPDIISMPQGKDPAEAVLADSEAWKKAVAGKQNYLDWLIQRSKDQFGYQDGAQKKKLVQHLMPWLKAIVNPVEKDYWLNFLASEIQISEKSLWEALISSQKKLSSDTPIQVENIKLNADAETLLIGIVSRFPQSLTEENLGFSQLKTSKNPILAKFSTIKKNAPVAPQLKLFDASFQKIISQAHLLTSSRYPNLTYTEALAEIMLLLKRIAGVAYEGIKDKFALAIAQAEKKGDREQVKRLIADLQSAIMKNTDGHRQND